MQVSAWTCWKDGTPFWKPLKYPKRKNTILQPPKKPFYIDFDRYFTNKSNEKLREVLIKVISEKLNLNSPWNQFLIHEQS